MGLQPIQPDKQLKYKQPEKLFKYKHIHLLPWLLSLIKTGWISVRVNTPLGPFTLSISFDSCMDATVEA